MGNKCGEPKIKNESQKNNAEKPQKSGDYQKIRETVKKIDEFKNSIEDSWLELLERSGMVTVKNVNINMVFWAIMMKISCDNPDVKDLSIPIKMEANPFVIKATDKKLKDYNDLVMTLSSFQNFIQTAHDSKEKVPEVLEQLSTLSEEAKANSKLKVSEIERMENLIQDYSRLFSQTEEQVPKLISQFKLPETMVKLYEIGIKSREKKLETSSKICSEFHKMFEVNPDKDTVIKIIVPDNEGEGVRGDNHNVVTQSNNLEQCSMEKTRPEQSLEKSISSKPNLVKSAFVQKPKIQEPITIENSPNHVLIYLTNYISLNNWNLVRSDRLMGAGYNFSFNISTMVDLPELSRIYFGTEEGKIYYVDYSSENETLSLQMTNIAATNPITAMCYLLNSKTLITGCIDGKVRINDLIEHSSRQLYEISSVVRSIVYGINGINLFIADYSKVFNFDLRNEKVFNQYQEGTEEIITMKYSSQACILLVGRINTLEVLSFEAKTNNITCVKKFKFEDEIVKDIAEFTKLSFACLMKNKTTDVCTLNVYNHNNKNLEKENYQLLTKSSNLIYCNDKKTIVNMAEDQSFRLINLIEKKMKDFSPGSGGEFKAGVVFNFEGQSRLAFGGRGAIDIWNCKAKNK